MFDKIDETDTLLIEELQKNGRKPLSQIAKKAGISLVAIKKRLTKLLDKGLISISADLNVEAFEAIATLIVEVENYIRLKEFLEMYKNCPRMLFLAPLSGTKLVLIIVGEDRQTLENVIGVCSVRSQKGVRRSEVYFVNQPVYPKYFPIRIIGLRSSQTAPCGFKCGSCESFTSNECIGCPSTSSYRVARAEILHNIRRW